MLYRKFRILFPEDFKSLASSKIKIDLILIISGQYFGQ
jgi:hypothetical protein